MHKCIAKVEIDRKFGATCIKIKKYFRKKFSKKKKKKQNQEKCHQKIFVNCMFDQILTKFSAKF